MLISSEQNMVVDEHDENCVSARHWKIQGTFWRILWIYIGTCCQCTKKQISNTAAETVSNHCGLYRRYEKTGDGEVGKRRRTEFTDKMGRILPSSYVYRTHIVYEEYILGWRRWMIFVIDCAARSEWIRIYASVSNEVLCAAVPANCVKIFCSNKDGYLVPSCQHQSQVSSYQRHFVSMYSIC